MMMMMMMMMIASRLIGWLVDSRVNIGRMTRCCNRQWFPRSSMSDTRRPRRSMRGLSSRYARRLATWMPWWFLGVGCTNARPIPYPNGNAKAREKAHLLADLMADWSNNRWSDSRGTDGRMTRWCNRWWFPRSSRTDTRRPRRSMRGLFSLISSFVLLPCYWEEGNRFQRSMVFL